MQALFTQLWLPVQHAVPHVVPAHVEVHCPAVQTWLPVHAIEQLPQWVASDATQEPLHSSVPDAHLHWPLWQVWPPRQGMPQPPQLFESAVTSMQLPLHTIWPALQLMLPPAPVVPAVPVWLLPPVPGLLDDVLLHAATRIAKPRTKRGARAVFITMGIPG
jgi:hypothetical protein